MKKFLQPILAALLCAFLTLCFAACTPAEPEQPQATATAVATATADNAQALPELWETATYTENIELGEGDKTVQVEVKTEEKSIVITVHTDKTVLGDALLEHELIAGEESEYGLYVKVVNGITADYDTDNAYWAFYQNGEYMNTGVSATDISGGEHYELVYTKG